MTVLSGRSCAAGMRWPAGLHCSSYKRRHCVEAVAEVFLRRYLPAVLCGNDTDCEANRFSIRAAESR
jgi:hypothetical protein